MTFEKNWKKNVKKNVHSYVYISRKLNESRYKMHKNFFASLLLKSVIKLIYDKQIDLASVKLYLSESTDKNPDESVNKI